MQKIEKASSWPCVSVPPGVERVNEGRMNAMTESGMITAR